MRSSSGAVFLTVAFAVVLSAAAPARLPSALAAAPPEIETLVEQMGGADQTLRYPAYRTLSDRRDAAAIGPIVERLASWDLTAQSYGVSVLQMLPADATAATWKRLLGSASPFVRVCAAVQSQSTDPARASKVLVETFSAPGLDPSALPMMLARVGYLRDAALQKAIRAFVRADSPPTVLGGALNHLVNVQDKDAPACARALLKHDVPACRAMVAAFLIRFGEEDDAGPVLAQALRMEQITYSDFLTLKSWLEAADHIPTDVLDALTARAETEPASAFVGAILATLGRARHGPAIPLMKKLLDSGDAVISKAAFDALAAIPGALDHESLKGQLAAKDPARRLAAAEALRRADDASGLAVVIALVKPDAGVPSNVRSDAVRALGEFRADAAVEPMLDAMTSDDANVRAQARSCLPQLLRALFPLRRFDFSPPVWSADGDATSRAANVAKLREWWQTHRDKAW